MAFYKTAGFKYAKNLAIGVGAAVVLLGALFKIESWEGGSEMLIIGMSVEACIFLMLGLIPPEKDYYWDKLYPGLDDYNAKINPLTAGPTGISAAARGLNADNVEKNLEGMLTELQGMSKSLGSLRALQEIDFSKTKDQMAGMNNFYEKLNSAMVELANTTEDAKKYKDHMTSLNKNLGSLNQVYGNMLGAMSNVAR
ncbi:MAG: gliding motility protein GldL [Saprospiraceae bacterium]|jgi:hypothetical protein|nr:gliding motility protein GldL [Saprospiraceae bacterium]